MGVNPLNLPRTADYVALCNATMSNLKPFIVSPYLVIDDQTPPKLLVDETANLGYSTRNYRREISRHNRLALTIANILYSRLKPLAHSPHVHPDITALYSRYSGYIAMPQTVVLPKSLIKELHSKQLNWMQDGTYWIYGCEIDGVPMTPSMGVAIATAMVMLDRHVIEAGTIDPHLHRPLKLSIQAENDFRALVSDLYTRGDATWHSTIASFLIGSSIIFRALQMRLVRARLARTFIATGKWHYLL